MVPAYTAIIIAITAFALIPAGVAFAKETRVLRHFQASPIRSITYFTAEVFMFLFHDSGGNGTFDPGRERSLRPAFWGILAKHVRRVRSQHFRLFCRWIRGGSRFADSEGGNRNWHVSHDAPDISQWRDNPYGGDA